MQVIFIQDVAGVAKRNAVKEVAEGFALNYLLPQGLAVRATPEKIQALNEHKEKLTKQAAQDEVKARQLASNIKDKNIVINKPASSTGTLYASVTPQIVAEALKEQHQVNLLPEQILVPSHIKTIGLHQIKVKLADKIDAFINLQINAT